MTTEKAETKTKAKPGLTEILSSRWFTTAFVTVGVILVKSDPKGFKAYIGSVKFPTTQKEDADFISKVGTRFGPEAAVRGLFDKDVPEGLEYRT